MPTQAELRAKITSTILDALQSGGLLPWRKPWKPDPNSGPATNVSGRKYQGINPLLLQCASIRHGFQSKWWGTWRQWRLLDGQVMKRPDHVPPGQWGTGIIFWSRLTKEEKDEQGETEEKSFWFMRQYTVFNLDQVVAPHLDRLRVGHPANVSADPVVTYEEADRVIEATGADIRYGGNDAYYSRKNDYIQVPLREQFTAPQYYETVFHELAHWSGHPQRLARAHAEGGYAFEELVAEMGSCFLATELGLPNAENLPNHASYLAGWLKAMQDDHRFIFQASSHASKAADYILSFSRQESAEPEPEEALVS